MYPQIGWAAGGMVGYDFVGPRVEIEGIYRSNEATVGSGNFNAFGAAKDDIAVMANILYDFNAGGTIVPYIGAGAGIAFVRTSALNTSNDTTQFAYQAIVGVGYNIDPMFRVNVDARYYGTTNPYLGRHRLHQQQPQRDAEPAGQVRRPAAGAAAAAAAGCPRRRSWCSSIGTARTSRSRP